MKAIEKIKKLQNFLRIPTTNTAVFVLFEYHAFLLIYIWQGLKNKLFR